MKLHNTINETTTSGAVGSDAVAAFSMPLFSNVISRAVKKKKKRISRLANTNEAELQESSSDNGFDTNHVISKLKALEKKNAVNTKDTVSFGLEDSNGGIVRVVVRGDQADSFEAALQSILVNQDEQKILDVAEVLFNLKNQYSIMDVIWPDIAEDEEENMELEGPGESEGPNDATNLGDISDLPEDGDDSAGIDGTSPEPDSGVEDEKSLLLQIIDMMKTDAEARKAEAIAKSAEAKAKEAEAAHAQILTRVKQEEQFLDMESHQKQQKETDREAKRLAQLARYKHDMSQTRGDADEDFSSDSDVVNAIAGQREEEEQGNILKRSTKRVAPADIAKYIMSRAK